MGKRLDRDVRPQPPILSEVRDPSESTVSLEADEAKARLKSELLARAENRKEHQEQAEMGPDRNSGSSPRL